MISAHGFAAIIGKWPPIFGLALLAAAPLHAADLTPEGYKEAVGACMRSRDYECAEKNWTQYIRLRPTDSNAIANLGIVMYRRDNHKGAIVQFERAIDMGEGTYDLFAFYADSLSKVGRTDDAINWSYKSLAVVPQLVDVRGSLAKLLVLQKKYYEALSLLGSFDDQMIAKGQQPYFEGQRIAIETALERNAGNAAAERSSLRLPKYTEHFYAPVTIGEARPAAFLVDTGASRITMSDDYLAKSKVSYKAVGGSVLLKTADGRKVNGRAVTVQSLRVGPYELKDVPVFTCKDCGLLLGQSALAKFDLKSSKVQGVEFLTVSPRN
jgi:predicted aspartyl protease